MLQYNDKQFGAENGEDSGSPRQHQTSSIAMSRIPWRLKIIEPPEAKASDQTEQDDAHSKNKGTQATPSPPPVVSFLQESYLDLRRQQNIGWAEERLVEGVAFSKSESEHAFRKAESCYKKGLDIVPDHADLLTAYGALLASAPSSRNPGLYGGSHHDQSKNRTDEALDLLDKALALDPDHKNAKMYKQVILDREMAAEACAIATQGGTNAGVLKSNDGGNDSDDSYLLTGSSWAESKIPPQEGVDLPPPEISEEKYPMLSMDGDSDDDDDDDMSGGGESRGDSSMTSSDGEPRRKRKHKRRKRKHSKSSSKRRKKEKRAKKEKRKKKTERKEDTKQQHVDE